MGRGVGSPQQDPYSEGDVPWAGPEWEEASGITPGASLRLPKLSDMFGGRSPNEGTSAPPPKGRSRAAKSKQAPDILAALDPEKSAGEIIAFANMMLGGLVGPAGVALPHEEATIKQALSELLARSEGLARFAGSTTPLAALFFASLWGNRAYAAWKQAHPPKSKNPVPMVNPETQGGVSTAQPAPAVAPPPVPLYSVPAPQVATQAYQAPGPGSNMVASANGQANPAQAPTQSVPLDEIARQMGIGG